MRKLYTLGIYLYTLSIRLAALFGHRNARLMVQGWPLTTAHRPPPTDHCPLTTDHCPLTTAHRPLTTAHRPLTTAHRPLTTDHCPLPTDHRPLTTDHWVWFHAASLGEFEQARPVLEAYRQRHPDTKVLLTFFSPSGYEVRKNYSLADRVAYLPMDTPRNARRLLDAYRPVAAFFVKYEFWYNYLRELRRRQIPTYLFSAIFRPEQYFFRLYGRWFLKQIRLCYRHIFVQNEESLQLLARHGINATLAGDTRFDRVHQIAQAAEPDAVAERFLQGHDGSVLVAGSTWPPDEQLLARLRESKEWFPERIIIAPHEIHEEHLRSIEALFPDSVRYSRLSGSDSTASPVLIIDNIGLLSKLYRYATVAYIGGGFGVGIHNILEAVAYGKPVVFGPNYHKFQEAHDLIDLGGCMIVDEHPDVSFLRKLFTDDDIYHAASDACLQLMRHNLGSTDIILHTIEK